MCLLRSQLVECVNRSLAGVLTGRLELDSGALGGRLDPEVREAGIGAIFAGG